MTQAATGSNPTPALGNWLLEALRRTGAQPALRWKRFGIWHPVSGEEVARRTEALARGLHGKGFANGDVAMIYAGNCCEWVIADLAIICAGGISAGIDGNSNAAELARLVNAQQAKVLFVEGEHRVHSALNLRRSCPSLTHIVRLREDWSAEVAADILPLADLEAKGAGERLPLPSMQPDAAAVTIFSSGTTGPARASTLSHRAIVAQTQRAATALGLRAGDERLVLTPIHHVLERVVGIYAALASGVVVNFAESDDTAFADLVELQPSVVQAAPRIWRKLRAAILLALMDATPLQRWAYRTAMSIAAAAAKTTSPSMMVRLARATADRLVLRPIRQRIGVDGARLCLSSGAAWHPDVVEWYRMLGRDTTDVYGQAEAGGATSLTRVSSGTARLEGVEAKLADDGEIWLRVGDTASDDWVRSGDIGTVEAHGGMRVLGRTSDALALSGGAVRQPFDAERRLKASPHVADAVVAMDGAGRAAALILIDFDSVVRFAQDRAIPFTHFRSLCQTAEVRELIGQVVSEVNRAAAPLNIASFELIERNLKPGDPEIGPALTLRRYLLRANAIAGTPSKHLERAQQTT